MCVLDQDGSFMGEFYENANRHGIYLSYVPAQAHWQMGDGERHGSVFREVCERNVDDLQIVGKEQMNESGCFSCYAKNMLIRKA